MAINGNPEIVDRHVSGLQVTVTKNMLALQRPAWATPTEVVAYDIWNSIFAPDWQIGVRSFADYKALINRELGGVTHSTDYFDYRPTEAGWDAIFEKFMELRAIYPLYHAFDPDCGCDRCADMEGYRYV